MNIGDRINIWVAGIPNVVRRAVILDTGIVRISPDNSVDSIKAVGLLDVQGRSQNTILGSGDFVVCADQSLPAYERS